MKRDGEKKRFFGASGPSSTPICGHKSIHSKFNGGNTNNIQFMLFYRIITNISNNKYFHPCLVYVYIVYCCYIIYYYEYYYCYRCCYAIILYTGYIFKWIRSTKKYNGPSITMGRSYEQRTMAEPRKIRPESIY